MNKNHDWEKNRDFNVTKFISATEEYIIRNASKN